MKYALCLALILLSTSAFARAYQTEWTDNEVDPTPAACAGPGDSVGGRSGVISCCAGLIRLAAGTADPAHCDAPSSVPVGAWVCAPCGNGVCDTVWGEDPCNCPADCQTAP